jgi:EAL domain-containing protein (putative c-di-GMP-specific phosphodiesterase class I)
VGAEALVRWNHPSRGLLAPVHFIELAEMSDLIRPLTLVVVEQALAQWRTWNERGHGLSVAVNISTRNLVDREFPGRVETLLTRYSIPAGALEFEITESALISDPERALASLDALSALGIRLSIDDFGTGYSSLSYLKRLPIEALKIDRSFVSQIMSSEHDRIIVQSTIELARNLDLEVIAEGVEDEQTLQALSALGCHLAQGYHIGRPGPATDLDAALGS